MHWRDALLFCPIVVTIGGTIIEMQVNAPWADLGWLSLALLSGGAIAAYLLLERRERVGKMGHPVLGLQERGPVRERPEQMIGEEHFGDVGRGGVSMSPARRAEMEER